MNAKVFAGTNGLGTIAGAVSQRHLIEAGFDARLVNDFALTGMPGTFWKDTFPGANLDGNLAVIVNIPLPPDGRGEPALDKIRQAVTAGTQIVMVDYPRLDCVPYAAAIAAGAKVLISSVPQHLYWGDPTPYSCRWGRIAAIANMDPSCLPVSKDEQRIVRGLDMAIRDDRPAALQALLRDDPEWFARQARELPAPPLGIQVVGKVAYLPQLAQGLGFKQLQAAAEVAGLPFALGEDHRNGFRILVANNWQMPELPVALKINLASFKGNGNAVVLEVARAEDADGATKTAQKVQELYELLNGSSVAQPGTAGNGAPSGALGVLSAFVRQFMNRLNIPAWLPEHGWPHLNRVLSNGRTIGAVMGLGEADLRQLDWAALLHDVGNGAADLPRQEQASLLEAIGASGGEITEEQSRHRHHEFSRAMILRWQSEGLFHGLLTDQEVEVVADLSLRHRKKMDLPQDAHTRKLCCIFRLSDALDVDRRRGLRNDAGTLFEDLGLPDREIPFWTGHRAIDAFRLVRHGENLIFEFLSTDKDEAAGKLEEVHKDLATMDGYANWDVRTVLCPKTEPIILPPLPPATVATRRGYWSYDLT